MLPLKVAFRFLKSGRGQTMLVIIGIAIAVSAQLFVGLLIDSLQRTIIDRTLGRSPHITITSATDVATLRDSGRIVRTIENSALAKVISVSVSGNALLYKGNKTVPVLLRGFSPDGAEKIYHIQSCIYEGTWDSSRKEVLVGKELKEELKFSLGDEVFLKLADGTSGSFKISGFYDLGVAQLNKAWIVTSINTAKGLFGVGERITSIEITVNDVFQADVIAGQLKRELNNNEIKVDNWKDENQQLLSGLQGQNTSSLMIQIFIIVSVVIAVASILAITVFQKSRQIGILKAMGIKDRSASLIFVFEALFLGLAGSIMGVALAFGLLYLFTVFTNKPGIPPPVDLYIDYRFVVVSWVLSILAAVVAGLIPARRSLRLDPIDVIREG